MEEACWTLLYGCNISLINTMLEGHVLNYSNDASKISVSWLGGEKQLKIAFLPYTFLIWISHLIFYAHDLNSREVFYMI